MTLYCVIIISFNNSVTVQSSVWSRNNSGVITAITAQTPIPNHNTVFNSTNGAFTDLVITNVTLEDNNTVYTCSALGANITSSVVLNVIGNLCVCVCVCVWMQLYDIDTRGGRMEQLYAAAYQTYGFILLHNSSPNRIM